MPPNPLIADASGNLYGTTQCGGNSKTNIQCSVNGYGVVFELSPTGSAYTETVLHTFCQNTNCTDGNGPYGPLLMDGQGRLLGTANSGGMYDHGEVFRVVPNGTSSTFSVRYNFCPSAGCADGSLPDGGLSSDANGDFYGTAGLGGLYSGLYGVLFKLHGTTESVLYNFCPAAGCADGQLPVSGVVLDGSGDLFGTTIFGGANSLGAVFEWTP